MFVCDVADAEIRRRVGAGHVVEAHHLRAGGRDGGEFGGVGQLARLREEEAEIDAVRLQRGGELVDVCGRIGRDRRDFREVVPGVLPVLAVGCAVRDIELVRFVAEVGEGERHRVARR